VWPLPIVLTIPRALMKLGYMHEAINKHMQYIQVA